MIIVPSLNITHDEKKVEELISKLFTLQEKKNVKDVHIDIADGKFTKTITPFPASWFYEKLGDSFNFFVHFMVNDLESYLEEWIKIKNFKKISFHLNSHFDIDNLIFTAQKNDIKLELVCGLNDNLYEILDMALFYKCESVEFLGVSPGPSGQNFDESILEKVKIFKAEYPNTKIFLDGGVNKENVLKIKEAGGTGVIVGSYLWKSEDVLSAYDSLNL
jgi:ribulose-phosphate 3-epimerase